MTDEAKNDSSVVILVYVENESRLIIGAIQNIELTTYSNDKGESIGGKVIATKVRFDKNKLEGIFANGIINPQNQLVCLQISVLENRKIITDGAKNCWLSNNNEEMNCHISDDWIMIDKMELEAESVITNETK